MFTFGGHDLHGRALNTKMALKLQLATKRMQLQDHEAGKAQGQLSAQSTEEIRKEILDLEHRIAAFGTGS